MATAIGKSESKKSRDMKKKNKRLLYYCLAVVLLALAGYQGYQKNSFYKSAYNDELPTEQSTSSGQKEIQDGKEYQSTGDLSLLDVKLPAGLDNQTVCYKAITVYFNKSYRVPNCVAYELTSTMTSMADSKDAENRANYKFERDHDVKGCPDWWDYKDSGYTRGHMAPAMDMRWNKTAMEECFLMTNICPQLDEMNDGEWRHVEEAVHKWSRTAKRLIVFTGPIFSDDMDRIGKRYDIAVPERFFKVVYSPEQNRAIAFVMENKALPNSWTNYATTIDKVEELTGYDFLASLEDKVENVIESKENIKDWPKYYPRR